MRNGRPTGPRGTGSSRGQTVAARDSGPGDGVLAAGASPGEAWSRAGWRIHLPDEPDPGELARRWGAATIPGLAAASAARHGGKPAITAGAAALTHGRLDREASAVAGWLAQRTGSGDPVLLVKQTGLGFVRWYLGALRAGAIVVLANPAAAAAELEYLLDDSGARLAGLNRPGLTVLGDPDLEAALASGRTLDPRPSPDDVAVLGYTSGTTGRPKGAALTHRELLTSIRSVMAAWRWRDDDVLVHALPLFHQHGLGGVHATLIAGSALALVPRFSPAGLVAAAEQARASVLFGVPTIYQALAGALAGPDPALSAGPLRRLRLAVCGSAPLSPELAGRLGDLLGMLPVVRYGTTETGLDVSNPVAAPRGDTVGVPLPGALARIWAGGAEAGPGTDGEVQLRGPQVFGGYWQNPEATAAAFTPDGWFRSGDIGCVDPASGHLLIRGRIKELIISGGINVYPREVEIALERHPAVAEVAVAGVPHERWGEQVTAWVVPSPGHEFSEEALIAHARALLSPYKCPKRVLRADSIPRNHMGKVLRGVLARDYPPDTGAGAQQG